MMPQDDATLPSTLLAKKWVAYESFTTKGHFICSKNTAKKKKKIGKLFICLLESRIFEKLYYWKNI